LHLNVTAWAENIRHPNTAAAAYLVIIFIVVESKGIKGSGLVKKSARFK